MPQWFLADHYVSLSLQSPQAGNFIFSIRIWPLAETPIFGSDIGTLRSMEKLPRQAEWLVWFGPLFLIRDSILPGGRSAPYIACDQLRRAEHDKVVG